MPVLWIAAAAALLLAVSDPGQSRDGSAFAAVLTILNEGVTIRRVNTELWLPLSRGAEAPFGPGDHLRTDDDGRALISVLDKITILVLPYTTYEFGEYVESTAGTRFASNLEGQAIHRTAAMQNWDSFRITTDLASVTQPAALFAVWSDAGQYTVAFAAEGDMRAEAEGMVNNVGEGYGMLARPDKPAIVMQIPPPLNAARLIGTLEGCPGIIRTIGGQNLNTRVGPNDEAWVVGSIPGRSPIQVMATDRANMWYRIQILSGFGWVRRELVETACVDLPALPGNTREEVVHVEQIQPWEMELFQPFYGALENDRWFYQNLAPTDA